MKYPEAPHREITTRTALPTLKKRRRRSSSGRNRFSFPTKISNLILPIPVKTLLINWLGSS